MMAQGEMKMERRGWVMRVEGGLSAQAGMISYLRSMHLDISSSKRLQCIMKKYPIARVV